MSVEVWVVGVRGDALAGVASSDVDDVASVVVGNEWEWLGDLIVYVEASVSCWGVDVACLVGDWGRGSEWRMSAAISEFRVTRVGVSANVWAGCSAPGVPDFKVGVAVLPPDSAWDLWSNYCAEAAVGADVDVRVLASCVPPVEYWQLDCVNCGGVMKDNLFFLVIYLLGYFRQSKGAVSEGVCGTHVKILVWWCKTSLVVAGAPVELGHCKGLSCETVECAGTS